MNDIKICNRNTLKNVKNWINIEDYESPPSLFNYGLPKRVYHLINSDISDELTECDVICYFISLFDKEKIPIEYLEIGVSVGKSIFQIIEYALQNTKKFSINGLDIEKINPILKELIDTKTSKYSKNEFDSDRDIKNQLQKCNLFKEKNSISKWLFDNQNSVTYYEANEFDKNIWKSMKTKYNIIFSDAMHIPNALLEEYSFLKDNNLIDYKKFIYCFDDLENDKNGGMWQSVLKIFEDLKKTTNQELYINHYLVNGWLGNNEYPHNFGVISNFEINVPV